jgi:ATP-dependent exoDNAse (exonuclease V) alpha subunit
MYKSTNIPFSLFRIQLPLSLSYSMSIHKSQGQTMDKVALFLNQTVFAHGQLYVALSRVRRLEDLKIYIIDDEKQGLTK